jgi:hypothetical protein
MSLTKVKYGMISNGQYNVRDYGAVGDGVTDDTSSIQSAIDDAGVLGGIVFVPAGNYLVTSLVFPSEDSIPANEGYVHLMGVGTSNRVGVSQFTQADGTTQPLIKIYGNPSSYYNHKIQGIRINGSATGDNLIQISQRVRRCSIEDVYLNLHASNTTAIGLYNYQSYYMVCNNVFVGGGGKTGIMIHEASNILLTNVFNFGFGTDTFAENMLHIKDTGTVTVKGFKCNSPGLQGVIFLESASNITLENSSGENGTGIEPDYMYKLDNCNNIYCLNMGGDEPDPVSSGKPVFDINGCRNVEIKGGTFKGPISIDSSSYDCELQKIKLEGNGVIQDSGVGTIINAVEYNGYGNRTKTNAQSSFVFNVDNVAASGTDVILPYAITMPRNGSIVGFSVSLSAAGSAGSIAIRPRTTGTPTGTIVTINGDGSTTSGYDNYTKRRYSFSAGDKITVQYTTDASWSPSTVDVTATVFVEFHNDYTVSS